MILLRACIQLDGLIRAFDSPRCHPMLNRSLTMLCLSLMRVSGWQMAPLSVPHGQAQCASSQTIARHAVAPQMCSYDRLSSEFQVCATPRRAVQPRRHSALPFRRRRG